MTLDTSPDTSSTRTRRFVLQRVAGGTVSLALPVAVFAQSINLKSPRITMVTWRGETDVEKGFRDYVRANGWTPRITTVDAAQDRNKLRVIAANLSRDRPDLVYSWGTPATLGLLGTHDNPDPLFGKTIPHVFALVADPLGVKLVRDLKTPARNITGVSHVPSVRAQVQAMQSYRKTQAVGMIYNRAEPNSVAAVKEWQAFAQRDGFAFDAQAFDVDNSGATTAAGAPGIVEGIKKRGADWLVLGPDTFLLSNLDAVAAAALDIKLPTFATTESQIATRYPVLAGLVSKFVHVGQFAGLKAQQLLTQKPDAPAVPIETLKRFAFVVRIGTAQRLGLYPPMALMDYAEFR
jgi:putative tryptophan/tyrosine transport system substrate-binding protein